VTDSNSREERDSSWLEDEVFRPWSVVSTLVSYVAGTRAVTDELVAMRLMDAVVACEIERALSYRNTRMARAEEPLTYEGHQLVLIRQKCAECLGEVIVDAIGPLALLADSDPRAPADGVLGADFQSLKARQYEKDIDKDPRISMAEALGLMGSECRWA
jgi:hypothetical protein